MIKQTWFGRILCALGCHLVVWGQVTYVGEYGSQHQTSLTGGCIRCNKGLGWDF